MRKSNGGRRATAVARLLLASGIVVAACMTGTAAMADELPGAPGASAAQASGDTAEAPGDGPADAPPGDATTGEGQEGMRDDPLAGASAQDAGDVPTSGDAPAGDAPGADAEMPAQDGPDGPQDEPQGEPGTAEGPGDAPADAGDGPAGGSGDGDAIGPDGSQPAVRAAATGQGEGDAPATQAGGQGDGDGAGSAPDTPAGASTGDAPARPAASMAPPVMEDEPRRIGRGEAVDVEDGAYVLRLGVGSDMVAAAKDGKRTTISTNVQATRASGAASQLWDITESGQPGWYYVSPHGTKGAVVLAVSDTKVNGRLNAVLLERTGKDSQLWRFVARVPCYEGDLDDLLVISKLPQGVVLDVYGGRPAAGTNIDAMARTGGKAQSVALVRQGDLAPTGKGVWIYDASGATTLTYWYGADGTKAKGRVVTKDEGAGGFYYAKPDGAIAKGEAVKSGGVVYLATASGKLTDLAGGASKGWLVTDKLGNGKRRYYLYRHGKDAWAYAKYGYSTDGYPHFTNTKGCVQTGTWKSGGRTYMAGEDGRMPVLAKDVDKGWATVSYIKGHGGKHRYYLYRNSDAGAYKGAYYARYGYSTDGYPHFTSSKGYVATGTWKSGGRIYMAGADGRMPALPKGAARGWVNLSYIKGHGSRRYYLYRSTANDSCKGAYYAVAGMSRDGGLHYVMPAGYVLRSASTSTWVGSFHADSKGVIDTDFDTVARCRSILEYVSQHRSQFGLEPVTLKSVGRTLRRDYINDVDISALGISAKTFEKVFKNRYVNNEWLRCVGSWSCRKDKSGKVTTFNLMFDGSQADARRKQEDVERWTGAAIRKARGISSQWDRATYLHDWLCGIARYDYSYSVYDAYDLYRTGKGVCAAYAEAYAYLCNHAGLECWYTVGDTSQGPHAWNCVLVNGQWLHTDVTWDDCGYGHYYNLRTKSWFASHDHVVTRYCG